LAIVPVHPAPDAGGQLGGRCGVAVVPLERLAMSGTKPATPEPSADAELDEALDESFPASDPPSQTDPSHGKIGETDPD
jgi:hypothetical protein